MGGEPCSLLTLTKPSGDPETGSPMNGVLVSARVKTLGTGTTLNIRVLRPTGTLLTFLNVGPETPLAVTTDPGPTGHITEATGLHHPIQTGDRLGVGYTQPIGGINVGATNGSAACAYRQGTGSEHPVDTEQSYSNFACSFEILVQGTVESDADGDGFGDDTQDLCPTDASTHGPCPVTAPPHKKKKCKKKKHRSAEAAKKKCKKKKRR